MNTKVNLQTILVVFLLSALVFASTVTFAQAQGEHTDGGLISPEVAVPGGPGFIMVSPLEFKPYSSTNNPWAFDYAGLFNPSTTLASQMVAGVALPHGSTLTKVTFYSKDNYSDGISLFLYRGDAEGSLSTMVYHLTSGTSASFRYQSIVSIDDPVVDNQSYSYFLYAYLPQNASTNLMLTNVRIDYEYPASLPLIMR